MAVPAALRSAHPGVMGVPSWAAVLIGVTGVLAGFAIEAGSGHHELGGIFTVCYVLGCVAAVLAVRQSGVFSAVIQPPLLLFVAVPLGYFLLHGAPFNGLKDVLITCGYPLIERFPLMLFTSAAVLLIGVVRWYLGAHAPHDVPDAPAAVSAGLLAGLGARLAGTFARSSGQTEARTARPRHVVDRSGGGRRPPRADGRGDRREAPTGERPRRERPARRMDRGADEQRPRRESARRTARDRDARDPSPPDGPRQRRTRRDEVPPGRDPRERRSPAEPRPGRGGRYESARYESEDRYPTYDPYEARPPRPDARRPRAGADGAHHPVSRVRYRGEPGEGTDYRDRRPR